MIDIWRSPGTQATSAELTLASRYDTPTAEPTASHLPRTPAPSAEDFAGVADHGSKLCLGERPTEARHAVAAVSYHLGLPGCVGVLLANLAGEPRTSAAVARVSMAARAAIAEDFATENQLRVLCAIGPSLDLRWRSGAGPRNDHGPDEQRERTNDSTGGGGARHAFDDTDPMGMDPTRPHRRRPSDYLFVGAGVLVTILLILWALFG